MRKVWNDHCTTYPDEHVRGWMVPKGFWRPCAMVDGFATVDGGWSGELETVRNGLWRRLSRLATKESLSLSRPGIARLCRYLEEQRRSLYHDLE